MRKLAKSVLEAPFEKLATTKLRQSYIQTKQCKEKKESNRKNVVINKIPKHTYACAHAHTDGSVLTPFPFDLVLSSGILSLSLVLNLQMSYLAVAPVCLDSSQSFYFEGQVLLGLGTSPRPSFHLELSSCFLAFSGMFFNIQY